MFILVTIGQLDMRSQPFRVLTFGWIVFGLVMLTVTHEVRCPRCGQRFYAKGAEFWQMTKECLHCGQEKYAEVSSGPLSGSHGK